MSRLAPGARGISSGLISPATLMIWRSVSGTDKSSAAAVHSQHVIKYTSLEEFAAAVRQQ